MCYLLFVIVYMQVMKRNEKGETPLHVAVINGNFARVRQLVRDVRIAE